MYRYDGMDAVFWVVSVTLKPLCTCFHGFLKVQKAFRDREDSRLRSTFFYSWTFIRLRMEIAQKVG